MKKIITVVILVLFLMISLRSLAQEVDTSQKILSDISSEITVGPLKEEEGENISVEGISIKDIVKPSKIAYVDVARVFDEYSRTKKAKADLDVEIKLKQKTIREMEKNLRKLRKEFENQKEDISEQEIKKKEKEIEEESNSIQIFTDSAETELSEKEAKLTETIIKEIYDTIYSFGKTENFSLIIDKSNVIYGDQTLELTDRLIEILENKK